MNEGNINRLVNRQNGVHESDMRNAAFVCVYGHSVWFKLAASPGTTILSQHPTCTKILGRPGNHGYWNILYIADILQRKESMMMA